MGETVIPFGLHKCHTPKDFLNKPFCILISTCATVCNVFECVCVCGKVVDVVTSKGTQMFKVVLCCCSNGCCWWLFSFSTTTITTAVATATQKYFVFEYVCAYLFVHLLNTYGCNITDFSSSKKKTHTQIQKSYVRIFLYE